MCPDIPQNEAARTVGQAIDECFERLRSSDVYYGHGTDNPWDEAVQLVLAVVDLPLDADDGVLPHPVSRSQWVDIREILRRRVEDHVPLPYLIGRAWFAGLEFRCDPRAIVPRSPIAELILNEYRPWYRGPAPQAILDLCCGGGCIGLAAAWYSRAHVDLVDLDPEALALARENIVHLGGSNPGLSQRVEVVQSDLFRALSGRRYDLILANPPYVDAADIASMPAEYHHEPEIALGSGADGLDIARCILREAIDYLEQGGLLVLEVGNSWEALEQAFPRVPFTWLEFEHGGHGVCALTAEELRDNRASFGG